MTLEEDDLPNQKIVTQSSESQKNLEAARPTNILLTKGTTMFGTWNVRTMYKEGTLAQVVAEMSPYSLCVLSIARARWTGRGQRRLLTGEMLLYS